MNINTLKLHLPKCLLAVLMALYLPCQGFAWGVTGHRVIGEIASLHLTSKARKELKKILGNESIAMASNWADFIKSDSTYNYLYNWHFININQTLNYEQFNSYLQSDTAVDAYTKLNIIVDSLKNKTLNQQQKIMYLRLLIHIAGDLHQPMHVGKLSDLGGNRVRVQWFNQPSNLHRIWDEQLVEFQQLSYTEYAAAINFSSKEERLTWQKQPVSDWIFESYQHCQHIYAGITADNQKLSYRYNFDYIGTVNNQLLKGGIRLAGLLNELFGK